MKPFVLVAALLAAQVTWAADMTPAEAFLQGKLLGGSGKTTAKGTVNTTSGQQNVPNYNAAAPESSYYGGARGALSSAATSKITNCQTQVAANAMSQQECDAINFLARNSVTRPVVRVDKNDPIVTSSALVINNPGNVSNSSGQVCRTVTQNNPGEYTYESCTTAQQTDYSDCLNDLFINIKWNYTCPANTVEGPTIIPETGGRLPPQGTGTLPPEANCHVKRPYDIWTCKVGDLVGRTCKVTTLDENGTEVITYPPATWSPGFDEYDVYADKWPDVIEDWHNQCAEREEKAKEGRKPYVECEETQPKVCLQGPETRYFEGVAVYKPCWEWKKYFACLNHKEEYDCGPRAYGSCTFVDRTCLQYTSAVNPRECAITQERYRCVKTPPSTTTQQVCEPSTFCQAGSAGCFDTARTPDTDFGKAAAVMEATRQAGVYGSGEDHANVFKGYDTRCTIKVLGGTVLKSCCGTNQGGAAYSNNTVLGGAVTHVVLGGAASVGKEAVKAGSKYVYDSLYQTYDSAIMKQGLGAMNSWASGLNGGAGFTPSFGAYGFNFSYSFANGFQFVGFYPASFAISIAVMMVQQWLSCEPDEKLTAIKKGTNLCTAPTSWCSKKMKIIGTCLERTERQCCFNSILAKLINVQGNGQLGRSETCEGFNEADLQRLDFSRMNFDEFIQTISPEPLNVGAANARANSIVTDKVNNYYSQP